MNMRWQLCLLLSMSCCIAQGKNMTNKKTQETSKTFTLTSPAFAHNKKIPAKYTCDGENISPALQWTNPPTGTKSFALIVDDPDVPGKTWIHWIIFNIAGTMMKLPEGIKKGNFVSGVTDFYYMKHRTWQYGGPCPPNGAHHYHFKLYALDTMLDLPQGADKEELLGAMSGHILGQAKLIGVYERKK
jgi:Raf kinase inhibitor-like YbhB/YbcL family protein